MNKPLAYYNEFDPFAAQWLRNLIAAGLIPEGHVDERSIVDVRPSDLDGYTQVHFFAGIGGWLHALNLAGWPADRPVWTGSCPCQPFSVVGKGKGVNDERHLWPVFRDLISECAPSVVFGEQVASAAGRDWLDGVRTDLEALGYAVGAADLCAAGIDAPHIRQRLYWVAVENMDNPASARCGATGREPLGPPRDKARRAGFERRSGDGCSDMGDAFSSGLERHARHGDDGRQPGRLDAEPPRSASKTGSGYGDVVDADCSGQQYGREMHARSRFDGAGSTDYRAAGGASAQGRNGTFWSDHEWRTGADGKARRAQSGIRLLVDGVPNRVGRLRGFGNAIVPQIAAEFISAMMEATDPRARELADFDTIFGPPEAWTK